MRVLYWGHHDSQPVPYFRGGQFAPFWPALGVEARYCYVPLFREGVADPYWREHAEDARRLLSEGFASLDWADVVVFRRWYSDDATERAWDAAAGSARVYDTDDWDLGTRDGIPAADRIRASRPLVERMAREADLVTVSTPALAERYGRHSRRAPVVIRNAVDADLYRPDGSRPDQPVTALFYGSNARLRDYFGGPDGRGRWRGGHAFSAVRDAGLSSVWVGCESTDEIPAEFDVVVAYDRDMRRFFRTLGNSHADIGLAPLLGGGFDECKSELHWLEMAAAGIPVVAERMMAPSPYSVVRDGVDGLLARGGRQWREAVARLAREPSLRSDIADAARERVAAEYDPRARAAEWASAFAGAAA